MMLATCMEISNSNLPSSSCDTKESRRSRSWRKAALIWRAGCQKAIGDIYIYFFLSEELRLYHGVQILTISNPGLKLVSSNACPYWTVHLFGDDDQCFLKEGMKTYIERHQCRLLINARHLFFSAFTSIVHGSNVLPSWKIMKFKHHYCSLAALFLTWCLPWSTWKWPWPSTDPSTGLPWAQKRAAWRSASPVPLSSAPGQHHRRRPTNPGSAAAPSSCTTAETPQTRATRRSGCRCPSGRRNPASGLFFGRASASSQVRQGCCWYCLRCLQNGELASSLAPSPTRLPSLDVVARLSPTHSSVNLPHLLTE